MSLEDRWDCKSVTLLLVLVMFCQASVAQGTSNDWANVENLAVDTAITIKTKAGVNYHGELIGATPDSIAIDSHEPAHPGRAIRRRELKREDVREILVTPAVSMLAGIGIGAGVGAGIGVGLDATAKSHEDRGLLAVLMGALGAAIGAAIAHHHPFVKGRKIYVAP